MALDKKRILTLAVLLAALAIAVIRRKPTPPSAPDTAVYKMLDAARAGDAKGYLDCFSGPMRDQLQATEKESSTARFSKYLREQNAAFTGVAVSIAERSAEDQARVRVEYVYRDRNEVQSLYLRKEHESWKIYKVAGTDQIKTLIPYGTLVTD